jgi:GntR family transcriptional regulator
VSAKTTSPVAAREKQGHPAYIRAQEAVRELVRAEQLAPGARIPSERDLAKRLGLSRMTVRQGMENLVRAGILERDSTNGTRVASVRVVRVMDSHRAFSMSQMVRSAGAEPGSRLLAFARGKLDARLAERLDMPAGSAAVTIRRLRTADALPICIETSYLPAAAVPGLTAEDLTNNASLYELLRARYRLEPTNRKSEISVAPIDEEDASLLGIPAGINVLEYRSTVSGADGKTLEHVVSVNHPERVTFSTDFAHIRL